MMPRLFCWMSLQANIDSLNEGIILKSLLEERKDKTIVLVSHRKSTMSIVDEVTQM